MTVNDWMAEEHTAAALEGFAGNPVAQGYASDYAQTGQIAVAPTDWRATYARRSRRISITRPPQVVSSPEVAAIRAAVASGADALLEFGVQLRRAMEQRP
jgi:hypothetical protein